MKSPVLVGGIDERVYHPVSSDSVELLTSRPLVSRIGFVISLDTRSLSNGTSRLDEAKSAALDHIQSLEDVIKQCKAGAGVWARGDRYATEVARYERTT